MRYQAVLFDMDGTVLDTLDDLYDSINHSLPSIILLRNSLFRVYPVSMCVSASATGPLIW